MSVHNPQQPRLHLTEPTPLLGVGGDRSAISLLLPPAEHGTLTGRNDRSLTDLHKDLDSIFTTSTPPKSKPCTPSCSSGRKLDNPRQPLRRLPQPSLSSFSCSPGQHLLQGRFLTTPIMSRIKSLSRVSLLDIPPGGSGGADLEDMYHTITGGRTNLMSASRPAIPFARITTTRRQEEAAGAASSLNDGELVEATGRYCCVGGGDSSRDNDCDSVQGLSEEVWRVSNGHVQGSRCYFCLFCTVGYLFG